jgi:Tol biopolymer transport system component
MNTDGLDQTQLTYGSAKTNPTLTPDGKWVLYNSTDNWQLWKVSVDGGELSQLTDFVASTPEVSSDGKVIACIGFLRLGLQDTVDERWPGGDLCR